MFENFIDDLKNLLKEKNKIVGIKTMIFSAIIFSFYFIKFYEVCYIHNFLTIKLAIIGINFIFFCNRSKSACFFVSCRG